MKKDVGQKKMVFAGPLGKAGETGGVVVLFEDLVSGVDKSDIFDTNAKNYASSVSMVLRFTLFCLLSAWRGSELSLHGTAKDFKYLGVILLTCHRMFGLKYHTRKFAGNYDDVFKNLPTIWKMISAQFLSNSECNFFETHYLVEYFKRYNKNTYWFPNYRNRSSFLTNETPSGRFVFVGQVSKEKGIDRLIKLGQAMPENWLIDVYGPLIDYAEEDFSGIVNYKGQILTEDVPRVLATYTALILPSFREGYPGVIMESYSVGLPVVVNDLRSLREIVTDQTGVIVDAAVTKMMISGLKEVVKHYSEKREGAIKAFNLYDRVNVLKRFYDTVNYATPGDLLV